MTPQNPSRPVGPLVPNWAPPPMPVGEVLEGRYARLEPMRAESHAEALFEANAGADWLWDYLPYGPFQTLDAYRGWMEQMQGQADPKFYAIRDLETGEVGGAASYLRVTPAAGTIEVGHINFSPRLQRKRAATEAMHLMMKWAFEVGYRRYEWKCDALNRMSRVAAQRLGFSYEGIFRQAVIVKGRNRDTAWFAMIDKDWPALQKAYEAWLTPANFTGEGQQRQSLSLMTAPVRVSGDPVL